MVLGDGIRRNVATISQEERNRLRDAFLKLDTERIYPDGVTYWDKQEDIHKNAHVGGVDVHGGPAFIPWHREITNRLEALLREVDPDLSLHYWDWTTDPRAGTNLFTSDFMGSSNGNAGNPFQDFESTEDDDPDFGVHNGHKKIWRAVGQSSAKPDGKPDVDSDDTIIHIADGVSQELQYEKFDTDVHGLHNSHDNAHGYIGGTLRLQHFSFHDPFVFLLHSNTDRLWAMWQTQPGQGWRLDPNLAYGIRGSDPTSSINTNVEPWSGGTGLRPWAPPDNEQQVKTYKDPTIVIPPCYDTLPTSVKIVEEENPGSIIRFNDVPEGETAVRAAVFKVFSCTDITLEVKPGSGPNPPYSVLTPPGSAVTVRRRPRGPTPFVEGRIWFSFTGTIAGTTAPTGSVIIRRTDTGEEFPFTLVANTIHRPTVAVLLTLDQSGSMGDPAGTGGGRKIDLLHEAASRFVELIQANNGIGIVSFNQAAYSLFPVTQVTGPTDPTRGSARSSIFAISPGGNTSIGNGVELAHNTLTPVTGYDNKAIIIFTDGLENTAKYIADIRSLIDERTFAIGLGSAEGISTNALNALTNGTGGYLVLTDELTTNTDDYFRLSKYFLQILAGVTNTNIVTDPDGFILPSMKIRIPFELNEGDIDTTVILLTDVAGVVQLTIETPDGGIIDPFVVTGFGGIYGVGTNMNYYRFTLPVPPIAGGGGSSSHSGTWYAVLEINVVEFRKVLFTLDGRNAAFARSVRGNGVQYSLTVQSYSNLRMDARLTQNSLELGAKMTLRAVLAEYGLPLAHQASVTAQLKRPDNTVAILSLSEIQDGVFETSITDTTIPGVYQFHIFGGDTPPPSSGPGQGDLCCLVDCLLNKEVLGGLVAKYNINLDVLRKCISEFCCRRMTQPPIG